MPATETTRIAAIGALYVLYLLVFVGFGPEFMNYWPETIIALTNCVLAVVVARRTGSIVRGFFVILACAFLCEAINVRTMVLDVKIAAPAWDAEVGTNEIPFSFLFFGGFLFLWSCAWGLRALHLLRGQRNTRVSLGAALVLASLAGLYAWSYQRYGIEILDAKQRFYTLFLALELSGLLLGLLCVLMGVRRAYLFMVIGFSLYAAADIVVVDMSVQGLDADSVTLDPVWALGRSLVLCGMVTLPTFRSARSGDNPARKTFAPASARHSALSSVLLIFSLGSVVAAAVATGLLWSKPHFLAMFFVIFSVACVVSLAVITAHFDEAVLYSRRWLLGLMDRKLESTGWQSAPRRIRHMLEITEFNDTMEVVLKSAQGLSKEVIFLGPEKLNRPTGRWNDPTIVTCFVMMPFGATWSDPVHAAIRDVCTAQGVQPIRGDDIFTPTDILDDIWRGIVGADFVIADITGRNTNVFYELGMAHAIGKPVLILSQSDEDIPIDLKTRRVLIYDGSDLPALEEGLKRSIADVLTKYELAGPEDAETDAEDGTADDPSSEQ